MTMNIYAKPGSKVTFSNPNNGYSGDAAIAAEHLTIGETYTVKQINVYDWSSSVEFQEIPNKLFNTVLFEDA